MKKGKRILAMIGVILIAGMYLVTLLAAIFEPEHSMNVLMAAIVCTIIIPVLIWAYELVWRLVKKDKDEREL